MLLAVTLYVVLFLAVIVAPVRWSLIAYLLLSTIDFAGDRSGIGALNTTKSLLLPLYLLYRLRGLAGHRFVTWAPIAWMLLIVYAAIASFWSIFPIAALKLVGHMIGLLLIGFVFLRAAKAGFIDARMVVPVTFGAFALATLCFFFQPAWTGEIGRFSSFMPAQGFAAFLAALFCVALTAKTISPPMRIVIALVSSLAVLLNGSRIWFFGILIATCLAFFISEAGFWFKLGAMALALASFALLLGRREALINTVSQKAQSNRIVAALTAGYEGNPASWGLGTFHFRRGIDALTIQRIEESSLLELIFGHGTSNGAVITGSLYKSYATYNDPNRVVHDDWLRIFYEWGLIGFSLWLLFVGSLALFAFTGVKKDWGGSARPLLVYLPAFLVAFAGENFLAGAGSAVTMGILFLIALASMAHRTPPSPGFLHKGRARQFGNEASPEFLESIHS